ncbi:MAG: acireductone synthase [Bdellovibrionales bacterium]|nr:acireductone synthase [Bdellovibrionales bacterium]
MAIEAVLTDIEGTTTKISFVHEVLFPYSSRNIPAFLAQFRNEPRIQKILDAVAQEAELQAPSLEEIVAVILRWIQEDKKIPSLKALQGAVWKSGYESGELKGHVYSDANEYLHLWKDQGLSLWVFSSGSVQAQKLLFGYSDFGDLTPLFSGYFDTSTGPKRESSSYEAIASEVGLPPSKVLFLSDIEAELEAAAASGMSVMLLERDAQKSDSRFPSACDFCDVDSYLKCL